MNALHQGEFHSRPLVAVEDHVYHISELLRAIQHEAPKLLASLTVVCLDRSGADTDEAVAQWLLEYPDVQVASRIENAGRFSGVESRVLALADKVFADPNEYCKQVAHLLRPGGVLLQDIELETLEFVPRDRWWETTMLASTVRGIVGRRAPRCAFISNKRGYEATFGAELLAAGHDPRDVLNKYELERLVVPFFQRHLNQHFPWELRWQDRASGAANELNCCRVASEPSDRRDVESTLDVVLWPAQDHQSEIGGKAFVANKKTPPRLATEGNEYQTWKQLILARLNDEVGVDVQQIGQRVAPPGALRAETTNAAARHIHALRKRLNNGQDIVTVQGRYRLRDDLKVGMARELP